MKICGCKDEATCEYLELSKMDRCPLIGQPVTATCLYCRDVIGNGDFDLDLGPANLNTEIETDNHQIRFSFQKVRNDEVS